MSKSLENVIVKKANQIESYTEKQVLEFARCADPVSGPRHFMENYFYIQHPTQGSIQYHPFEYQSRLIDIYHNYRFSISLMPRQTGKSTSAAGYLLWYAMFVPDSTILVAAHKYLGAQEIMQRVRYAYENCPDFIRAGVVTYNKGSIDFENGSRIVAQTTTENTGRGMSISLLYCDEFAFVRPTIASDFWASITPTLATGGKCIITSTPNSDEDQFALIWKGANKCVDEHGNPTELGVNGFKAFRSYWQEHPDRDEKWANEMEAQLGEERFRREMECITQDSILTLRDSLGKIFTATISELEKLLTKDTFVEELVKNKLGLQVLTDTGWSEFDGVLNKGSRQVAIVQLERVSIKATLDHKIFTDKFDTPTVKQLTPGTKICTTSGIQKVVSVKSLGVEQVYDLLNVKNNHRFYANGILCSNCEFIIFDETLINSVALFEMGGIEPIERQGQVRWYKRPEKGCTYVIALDPSLGTGGDPAAIQIFEMPGLKQVGEWQHNKTPVQRQVTIMKEITTYLSEIAGSTQVYYSVENNTLGEAALQAIAEIGEENIPGVFLSEPARMGTSRSYRKGFTTLAKSKLSACAKIKNWIETKKLTIASKNLISELKTFVAAGTSFRAKLGETDDLVMAALLAVRMIQVLQEYDAQMDAELRSAEERIDPMPFISLIG
jgi:hypothetical protein